MKNKLKKLLKSAENIEESKKIYNELQEYTIAFLIFQNQIKKMNQEHYVQIKDFSKLIDKTLKDIKKILKKVENE